MAMPKSWVAIFERFGFYWLGHDVLQDTMHFEFLGDPGKIAEPAPAPAAAPAVTPAAPQGAPTPARPPAPPPAMSSAPAVR